MRKAAISAAILVGGLLVFGWVGRAHDALALPAGVDPLRPYLPFFEPRWLIVWLWLLFHPAVFAAWLARDRARVPYCFAMIGFFLFVRAAFIGLGPVGPPEEISPLYEGGPLEFLHGTNEFQNEMFFSGHTGAPYLYALLSWHRPVLRNACLATSAAMAIGILVSRNHYSIDVLGAWFVTYSIFALGRRILKPLDA